MRITGNYTQQYVSDYKKTKTNKEFDDVIQNELPKADILKSTTAMTVQQRRNIATNKTNLESILSKAQTENAVRQAKNSVAPPDTVFGFKSADVDSLTIGAEFGQYEKPGSVYDIPDSEVDLRLQEIIGACSRINSESLSKGEMYNRIESIFKDYLGDDFLESGIVYGDRHGTTFGLGHEFENTLRKYDLYSADAYENQQVYIEAKGYAGMSKSEMRTIIRSQYPKIMTLKECLLMEEDLYRAGLENTAYVRAAIENIATTIGATRKADSYWTDVQKEIDKVISAMLDQPADYDGIKAYIETFRQPDGHLQFTYKMDVSKMELIDVLLSYIGGGRSDISEKLTEMLDEMQKETGFFLFDK